MQKLPSLLLLLMVTLEAAGMLCSLLKCRPLIMTLTANCQRMRSAAITNKLHS